MPTLSDRLADYSVWVGDIEARIAAFKNEQSVMREKKPDTLRADVNATQERLISAIKANGDEISSVWAEFGRLMKAKGDDVSSKIDDRSRKGRNRF